MAPWRLWDLDPWLLLGCPAAVLASASGGAGALWGGSVGALCCIAGAARFAACGRRGIARAGPLSTGRAVLVEWVCAGGARVVAAANARPGHGPCVAGVIAESGPAAFASCGSCFFAAAAAAAAAAGRRLVSCPMLQPTAAKHLPPGPKPAPQKADGLGLC
eukprot:scaffold53728_cov17-Tisochrysis_lutea.AAC.1